MPNPRELDEFIESIPDPQTLRVRLAQNQRERDLLRRLIRLSEEKQKVLRIGREEVCRG